MKNILSARIIFIFLLLLTISCESYNDDPIYPSSDFIAEGKYLGQYWPTNGWRYCAPDEVGMDRKKLKELNEEILLLMELHIEIHSILIVKDGYIVAEQYYSDEYGPDNLHPIASCTKSITSSLFGIAQGKGNDFSLSDRMIDYFPEYEIDHLTTDKKNITLENLLTMSSGLEWYELEYPYGDERNTYTQWINSGGGVEFVLDRPVIAPPGEVYSYNTGASHVLSGILQKITGTRTDSFAMKELFGPLGISDFYWYVDGNGIAYGGSTAELTPRDMARFGYLYLKNGAWEGKQLVPAEWVAASHQPHIKRRYIEDYYYGYQWWVSTEGSYSAVGYRGQWITVVPEHDLVVVMTNHFDESDGLQLYTPERLMETYILPAVQ